MLFSEEVYRFMYAALSEAEKALEENEVPIGAVVVHKNRIIGRGYNQTERLKDPTAHAEILAITSAANHLQNWRLNECDIYVNVEPCVMCTGAMIAARIDSLYFSTYEPKFGACGSLYNIAEDGRLNHKIKVYSGIYAEESRMLMKEFFQKTRSSGN
ncbi:MAG: tRNA adenosine(34) deaminase TadA [Bacteroidota bacterium]|nr:nucleoside deaminase [Ignavibacteria bacterium]HEX2962829.1 tRNA adenosine(34) deaminase TadA [Ignavibacteriales bacterium]MCU7499859.1 nucleoside deaminase [Ignavibacteria bacterium]MCU7511842.1 nucleoside deaminase [Ignavibacteria bacterium]MCU7519957.1 nucleoside deaminase [Ignavibacteria bacterium]